MANAGIRAARDGARWTLAFGGSLTPDAAQGGAVLGVVTLGVVMLGWAAGCGARTEPIGSDRPVAARDAGCDEALRVPPPVVPPSCGRRLTAGAVRGVIERVHTPAAIDADGNLYFGRRADDRIWRVVSLDSCLRERWTAVAVGAGTSSEARIVVDGDDVWIVSVEGDRIDRFSRTGERREPRLGYEGHLLAWLGIQSGSGPVLATRANEERILYRYDDRDAERSMRLPEATALFWSDLCALSGATLACPDVAYDLGSLAPLWNNGPPPIIGGGPRRLSLPAIDRGRMYGITSWTGGPDLAEQANFDLVALDVATGDNVLTVPVGHFRRDRVDVVFAPPIVTECGTVIVSIGAGQDAEANTAIGAYSPAGLELWRVILPRRYQGPVIGADKGVPKVIASANGLLYTVVDPTVYALREADGSIVWRRDDLGDLGDPGLNLSGKGELYLRTAADQLVAIATGSPGLGRRGWPHAFANAGLSNWRP